MRAKLISRWGAEKGGEHWIAAEASIGRGGDNDVRLDAKPVSSQHARLFFDAEAGAYFLEDLGSLNGTQIDGTAVVRTERLGRLHVLNFGGVCEFLFVTVDTSAETEKEADAAEPTPREGTRVDAEPPSLPGALADDADGVGEGTRIERSPVALPPGLGGEPPAAEPEPQTEPEFVLAVMEGGTPHRFSLREGENLIGRSKSAQVVLASRQLSRRHALLTVSPAKVTLRDLGSRNHTYVDGERLGEREVEIEARARLRFGLLEAYLLRRDDGELTMPVDTG